MASASVNGSGTQCTPPLAITLGSVGSPGSFDGGSARGNSHADIEKGAFSLVTRHDKAGKTHAYPPSAGHFDVTKNSHITVGHNTMPIRVL